MKQATLHTFFNLKEDSNNAIASKERNDVEVKQISRASTVATKKKSELPTLKTSAKKCNTKKKKNVPKKKGTTAKRSKRMTPVKIKSKPSAKSEPPKSALLRTGLSSHKSAKICKQIEYYLSDENLKHDDFYRNKILSSEKGDGWMSIKYIMTAKRIESMDCSVEEILEALERSFQLETLVEKDDECTEEDYECLEEGDNAAKKHYLDVNKVWIRRRGGRKLPRKSTLRKNYNYSYGRNRNFYNSGWKKRSYSSHYDYDDYNDQWDGGILGYNSHDCDLLLEQGVKPWDDDADAVLGVLY